jgi:MFS family permease
MRWLSKIVKTLLPPRPWLSATDLLRDLAYRRLWTSIVISSLGGQVTMLALPLTAAILLHASPTQMGLLTAMEIAPFVLFSLPAGVWLDRVRKLPVYVMGECTLGLVVGSVPLAWWAGWLGLPWLYACGFVIGTVYTIAGSAAQIVLTQVVPRDRLVEAHAKNALASSGAEVAGPGIAGALIKAIGAPVALLVDAVLVSVSAAILRGIVIHEQPWRPSGQGTAAAQFWVDLKAGVRFVARNRLLIALATVVGSWQACHQAALVVQILFATRTLGLSEQAIGMSYTGMGVGTIIASVFGNRISRRFGPGRSLVAGIAISGAGWSLLSMAPANAWGVAVFTLTLMMFSTGAVLIFINFLGMRQAVTPAPLLGRMTSTMRWLILIPAGPGALLGGWLGEHYGLRSSLAVAGAGALVLALAALRLDVIRNLRQLPQPESVEDWIGAEAEVRQAEAF